MISQYQAQKIADELFRKYIPNEGYKLQFIKSTTNLGQCWFQSKVITLSLLHLNSASEAEVIDTIKHEIAHALTGPAHKDHTDEWKRIAQQIGCTALVCGQMNVNAARAISKSEMKETIQVPALTKKCPVCGKTAIELNRCKMGENIWIKLECSHLVKSEKLKGVVIDEWISESGKSLYGYQATGIKKIGESNGRLLIADEPGLGKTVQALGFLKFWPDLSLPCLWICKSKLKMQTIKEALDWCGLDYMAQTIDTSKSFIIPGLKLYIISMDLLRRIDNEKLDNIGIKTIVVDEIQHFKNPDSSRTVELRRLVGNTSFFIALSGTPWKNRGSEYFPVLNMLDPSIFPSFLHFKNHWVETIWDKEAEKYREGGIANLTRFKEITKHIVIRRMRDDVQPDLPKINRQVRFIELDKIYGDDYNKAESKVAAIIKAAILEGRPMKDIGTMIMQLKHITGLAKVDTIVEDAIQHLEDTDETKKLTIFHHHIDVGDLIEEKLNKYLIENKLNTCLRIKGGLTGTQAENIKESFLADPKNRILIASQLAAGEGLNLQFCTDAIMAERQWNPANEEQCELRFSRPITISTLPEYLKEYFKNMEGKQSSIRIPYAIAVDTVDEMLTGIVERKRIQYNKSMNDPVCESCKSKNCKIEDKEIICFDCNYITSLRWNENSIIKELTEMIIKKRYGKLSAAS